MHVFHAMQAEMAEGCESDAYRSALRKKLLELALRMRTRGPDGNGFHGNGNFGMAHTRLAIMDPERGQQPLVREKDLCLVANGEIYNYKELQKKYEFGEAPTNSDSEVKSRKK